MKAFILICLVLPAFAQAATYNFIFNNTEQGANSTASPQMNVNGATSTPTAAATATDTSPATSTVEAPTSSVEPKTTRTKWKLMLGGLSGRYATTNTSPNFTREFSGPQGSLTYYFVPEAGIGLQLGQLIGPEFEFSPWGVPTGWGKIQAGATVGLLVDRKGYVAADDPVLDLDPNHFIFYTPPEVHRRHPVNIYVGGQVGLNVVGGLAAIFSYKIAPIKRYERIANSITWSVAYVF